MKKSLTLLTLLLCLFSLTGIAQTVEELTAQKTAKDAELEAAKAVLAEAQAKVDGLTGEVAALTEAITPYPRWGVGTNGTLGLSFTGFEDWLAKEQRSTRAVNIAVTGGAFANGEWEDYFWRNNLNITAGWLKFDDRENDMDADTFQVAADAFNVSSLFGYKFSPKLAASVLAEYRSTIIDNFNNPGFLDAGVGATWTPMSDLVVVVHPLNYNFVFSDQAFDFQSSLGCKVVADYKRTLVKGIAWKSNFSGFYSYEGSDLHNWTWINGFTTAVKGIGVGLELGLRNNKQEAEALNIDNTLQLYYILGFSYSI